jgi:anti-sigma factor RsiW
MNCKSIQAGFDERLDGRLDAARQQEFDAHIAECAECRREWQAYGAAWQTLLRHGAIEPSLGFVERTLRRLDEPETVAAPALWRPTVFRWVTLTAVAIAIGLGGRAGWQHYQRAKQAQIYASVREVDFLGEDFEVIASLDQLNGGNNL